MVSGYHRQHNPVHNCFRGISFKITVTVLAATALGEILKERMNRRDRIKLQLLIPVEVIDYSTGPFCELIWKDFIANGKQDKQADSSLGRSIVATAPLHPGPPQLKLLVNSCPVAELAVRAWKGTSSSPVSLQEIFWARSKTWLAFSHKRRQSV